MYNTNISVFFCKDFVMLFFFFLNCGVKDGMVKPIVPGKSIRDKSYLAFLIFSMS